MRAAEVRVRLFASLRELAGTAEIELELHQPTSVESCWRGLCQLHPGLNEWRDSVRPVLNLEYVDWDAEASPGDEIAFLPPVSGGAPTPEVAIHVQVSAEPIDVAGMSAAMERRGIGAIATFVGLVRDPDEGVAISHLTYEAYLEMAEPVLVDISEAACRLYGASEVRVQHRIGTVESGIDSVAVVVGAPHRHQALDACRFIIDELKSRAPIWKSAG
ncbi:MAG: molybdenum cofactor biosynthesis protein MoaE [Candidatus Dormiibacterota bacterium]|jgi:molybdopterin synthase catalytic subunit/molybdopterin converting factor small subunit